MAYTNPLQGHPNATLLRKRAGRYVKALRESAGLTQNELAQAMGWPYYTMVSQIESGKTRIPSPKIVDYAKAVKADPKDFAKRLLAFYDPYMWMALYGTTMDDL